MNTKQLIAAAALAFVGASASVSAFASEAGYAPQPASTLSRTAVQAATISDKALPSAGEASYSQGSQLVTSTLSRDDVRTQTRAYVRSGQASRDARTLTAVGG